MIEQFFEMAKLLVLGISLTWMPYLLISEMIQDHSVLVLSKDSVPNWFVSAVPIFFWTATVITIISVAFTAYLWWLYTIKTRP